MFGLSPVLRYYRCITVVLEPCADVILSVAARRVILIGGSGAPIDFFSAAAAPLKCRHWRRRLAAWESGVKNVDHSSPIFITISHVWLGGVAVGRRIRDREVAS